MIFRVVVMRLSERYAFALVGSYVHISTFALRSRSRHGINENTATMLSTKQR